MRPIKFRAWHTTQKKMYSAEELGADQMTLSVDGRGFVNVHGANTRLSQFAGERMIPMQFTGLHDKNGKEIWEGDIIRKNFIDGTSIGHVVYTNNARFVWIEAGEGDRDGYGFDALDWARREVIGNIHENPELVEP